MRFKGVVLKKREIKFISYLPVNNSYFLSYDFTSKNKSKF